MPQDDARELQMIDKFNLTVPDDRKRHDIDAYLEIDGLRLPFELKSTTKTSVSTVRDFGPDHIEKWRNGLHWIFAFYTGQSKLEYCYYASPLDMESWISRQERYVAPDFYLADVIPSFVTPGMVVELLGVKDVYSIADARQIMKNQWTAHDYLAAADIAVDPSVSSKSRNGTVRHPPGYSLGKMTEILQLRCTYVIKRGSTLNNPHISASFFSTFEKITSDHAAKLRELVRDYLAKADPTEVATA